MSLEIRDAKAEMYGKLRDAVLALGFTDNDIRWEDVAAPAGQEPPPAEGVWFRPSVRHAYGGQTSLAGGQTGKKRWGREGTLWVQVFSPLGTGSVNADIAAQGVLDAFEGKSSGCLWFRNCRLNEVGQSGAYYQINVLIDFVYDQVK